MTSSGSPTSSGSIKSMGSMTSLGVPIFSDPKPSSGEHRGGPDRSEIAAHHLDGEQQLVDALIERARFREADKRQIEALASRLVGSVRQSRAEHSGIDAFMHEYALSSEEGVLLMCLAESLLRIPDAETADQLIAEKIGSGEWANHVGRSDRLLVNASTWGLMLTGRVVNLGKAKSGKPASLLNRMVARSGEPLIRQALRASMRVMGDQFVLGRTIEEAMQRAQPLETEGYRFSYDMLGEAARTEADADRYYARYAAAVEAIGAHAGPLVDRDPEALMRRPAYR